MNAKQLIKELTPPFLHKLRKNVMKRNGHAASESAASGTGAKYLAYAREFSASIGGETAAFDRSLDKLIASGKNELGKQSQDILVAFTPNYKENLYQYYKSQQFNLLFRFLQYPFLYPDLAQYIEPYARGIDQLDRVDILDYGCGIPYGLLECLGTPRRSKIASITLIDLDLLHMQFTQFLLKKLAPEIPLTLHLQHDTEAFPALAKKYNLILGKDVFEHLADPEAKLKKLLAHAADKSVCFFDFADRAGGVIHQHISPQLAHLHAVMATERYRKAGEVNRITEYAR